jgi:hypothetical protein
MCSVQTSLFVVTFPSHISLGNALMVDDLDGLGFRECVGTPIIDIEKA